MLAISESLPWPPTEFPIRSCTELQTLATDCLSTDHLTVHPVLGKMVGGWICGPAFLLRVTQLQVPCCLSPMPTLARPCHVYPYIFKLRLQDSVLILDLGFPASFGLGNWLRLHISALESNTSPPNKQVHEHHTHTHLFHPPVGTHTPRARQPQLDLSRGFSLLQFMCHC